MDINTLKLELQQMIASRQDWQNRLTQAQQAQAQAQEQLLIHGGHIERLNMWIKRLEEQPATPAPAPEIERIPVESDIAEPLPMNGNTTKQTAMERRGHRR